MRAEVTGQSVGSDASPLSCFLFRPRKTREKRRKRSHTNVSNASVIRTSRISQTSPQTPPPYFYQWVSHGKKWSWHNRLQNAPRLFSLVKVSTPSALRERFHTAAHTAKQGPPLPRPHAWLSAAIEIALNAAFAILDSATLLYTYISRFFVNPHYQRREKIRQSCSHKFYPPTVSHGVSHGVFQLLSQTLHVRFHGRKRVHSLGFAQRIAHSGSRGETGAVSDGGAITTLGAFHTFRKPCVARCQNGKLCRFWVLVGGTPEGHREPAEQRCAYARRCSEASRPRWAALPAAASCAASTISEVRYPCTEAQRKNYRLRHTSDCPASLACALLRAADSSNAQSC